MTYLYWNGKMRAEMFVERVDDDQSLVGRWFEVGSSQRERKAAS